MHIYVCIRSLAGMPPYAPCHLCHCDAVLVEKERRKSVRASLLTTGKGWITFRPSGAPAALHCGASRDPVASLLKTSFMAANKGHFLKECYHYRVGNHQGSILYIYIYIYGGFSFLHVITRRRSPPGQHYRANFVS